MNETPSSKQSPKVPTTREIEKSRVGGAGKAPRATASNGRRGAQSARGDAKPAAPAQRAKDDRHDDLLVNALRARADLLRARSNSLDDRAADTDRRTAQLVDWAASERGRALRDHLTALKSKQSKAPSLGRVLNRLRVDEDRPAADFADALGRAELAWRAEFISNESGRPLKIDVVDYVERLASLIATARLQSRWMRSGKTDRTNHLAKIRTKALELAKLLEAPEGPTWPPAIELFDEKHRAVWGGVPAFSEYRIQVRDRLYGQLVAGVMRNLAEQTSKQARLDALESDGVPRPTGGRVFYRHLSRDIRDWFVHFTLYRRGDAISELVASLVNASRLQLDAGKGDAVTAEEVKEWLRPPRKRSP